MPNIPIEIPETLLEEVARGNALLFIGDGLTRTAQGQPLMDHLCAHLAARCDGLPTESLNVSQIAQAYEYREGRRALVQAVRDQVAALGDAPQRCHRLIAGLTACTVLATTGLDGRLERAFAEAGRELNVTTGDVDVPFTEAQRATLYKLRGRLDQPDSLVLTEDDHETFFRHQAGLSTVLKAHLATKTILFLDYDLDDPYFKRFYREITEPLDQYARRAYVFGKRPPDYVREWCERNHIHVIEVEDTTAFLAALSAAVDARRQPAPAQPVAPADEATDDAVPVTVPKALPERPYKLLDYYEPKDAGIFFGREAEIRRLVSLIHAHRLVLLYGASGAGKTSLLLAGAVPRLERADPAYETLYVRALEDPAQAIRRAIARKLAEQRASAGAPHPSPTTQPPNDPATASSLVDVLHTATQALDRPLVLILDQFEEFFIRLSPEFRRAFIAELGALYDARDVPVKVVLSLREDWLGAVSEIERRIPEVFRTKLRLLPLTRDQARRAIVAPVAPVAYAPALVERLLDDLSRDGAISPPQLQLVCSALYERRQGETQITVAAYEALGGAQGVLRAYLDDELARLPSDEGRLARALLEALVTSERTKAVRRTGALARALDADAPALDRVLEKLVNARLLRVVALGDDGERAYELAHEYLIAEIALSPEAVARKEAEELLRQGVANAARFDTLLSAEAFDRIDAQRDRLRLDGAEAALLLRSALRHGRSVGHWLGRMEDEALALKLAVDALLTPEGADGESVCRRGLVGPACPRIPGAALAAGAGPCAPAGAAGRAAIGGCAGRDNIGRALYLGAKVVDAQARYRVG